MRDNIKKSVFKQDASKCIVCSFSEMSLEGEKILEAAHILPEGGGENGPYTMENLVSLCPRCHRLMDYYYLFYFDEDSREMVLHESYSRQRLGIREDWEVRCPERIHRGYLVRRKQIVTAKWEETS